MADFSIIVTPRQSRSYYEQRLKDFMKHPTGCEHKGEKGCKICEANKYAYIAELKALIASVSEMQIA
jgi:putative ribosome biogenesis GTPase RsgA